ncbi:hypothetical protein BgiBS90_015344, partial [Biomphalaria glabrata]
MFWRNIIPCFEREYFGFPDETLPLAATFLEVDSGVQSLYCERPPLLHGQAYYQESFYYVH